MMDNSMEKTPISEISTGGSLVVKSPPAEGSCSTLQTKSSKSSHDEASEGQTFLLLGVLQLVLGILMAVFGILAIVHDASLSSVGAGLWGGAIAIASGGTGLLAGFRGCYANSRIPSVFLSAFLAMCLISLAVTNLVVVLTITGIVRDGSRPEPIQLLGDEPSEQGTDEDTINLNWSHVLANCGLLLVSVCQCVAVVISGYRCYQRVCPCSRHRILRESPEPAGSFYSTTSKDMLITKWLGHQPIISTPTSPNLVLLPANTVFQYPPPTLITGYPPPPAGCIMNSRPPPCIMRPQSHIRHFIARGRRRRNTDDRHRRRRRERRYVAKTKNLEERVITEEEVAKTYTGLDREIAEEFIAIAMEPGVAKSRSTDDNTTMSDLSEK